MKTFLALIGGIVLVCILICGGLLTLAVIGTSQRMSSMPSPSPDVVVPSGVTTPEAEPPAPRASTVAGRTPTPTPAPAPEPANFEVKILDYGIDKIPMTHLGSKTESEEKLLYVKIRVTNLSATKKTDYKTWRGADFSFGRDFATATDDLGNNLKRCDFGFASEIDGTVKGTESIYPKKSLEDMLIFERPVDGATKVTVSLPRGNIGETGKPIVLELAVKQ